MNWQNETKPKKVLGDLIREGYTYLGKDGDDFILVLGQTLVVYSLEADKVRGSYTFHCTLP